MSGREPTTVKNHLEHHTPPLHRDLEQEWDWPFWKFGYGSHHILFTELHAQFNSVPCAIQDPYGWHLDVCDIANEAKTRPEFLSLLQKRQDERFAELRKAWEKTRSLLIGDPGRWEIPQRRNDLWLRFARISRNFSYDAFLGYFGAYVEDGTMPARAVSKPTAPESERRNEAEGEEQPNAHQTEPKQNNSNFGRDNQRPRLIPLPESLRRKFEAVEPSVQATTSSNKGETPKPSSGAATSPRKVVKRRTRRNKATGGNPECLRRSARLQQRSERRRK
ncbi:hypothetical protein E0Z10_g10872 [Xylaria hypoxylon]|uniref:Uncharacterized protein n=1 Tax=Xylaria hypoxylon TaxID=37992 RepID=A0A4Z0Y0T3_9PEZI|nr:hypothetical protein E0Z10_g10872 [Xylaria hypoxylon]